MYNSIVDYYNIKFDRYEENVLAYTSTHKGYWNLQKHNTNSCANYLV